MLKERLSNRFNKAKAWAIISVLELFNNVSFADGSVSTYANGGPQQTVSDIGSTLGNLMKYGLSLSVLGLGAAAVFHTVKGYTHAHSEAKQERSGNPVFAGITGAMTNSLGWWVMAAIAYYSTDRLIGGGLHTLLYNFINPASSSSSSG